MFKIGIECENLEDSKSRWGVGQITLNLLEEYAKNAEWQKEFKLYLYFKCKIPNDQVLANPIFEKRLLRARSFNFFYHILMPIRAMLDRLDYMFFPAYMLPPLYLRKSVVMLTDDVYYEYKFGNLPFRYRLAYRLFTNWAAIKAKKILAISETSKNEVAKLYGIKPERIFVSHLGVRQPITSNQKQESLDSQKSSISSYILYVGQMFPRRHAKETILAFKEVAPGFPDLKLIMVGRDKYRPALIDKLIEETNKDLGIKKIDHYDYLENYEDIKELYAGAKAIVYVSDREAFGLPPMEALSFGIPPIVKDNELGHELFGEYAFYAKDSTPQNIAEAIGRALTDIDKRGKIKNSGPEMVKKYSWYNFANNFFQNVKKT